MAFRNRLGGHSNSYHTYSLEEALEGIAAAGYKFVELSAVRGWTEHVPLEADAKTLGRILRMMNKLGLMSLSLSGHSDLTTKDGLRDGLKAVDLCERMGISRASLRSRGSPVRTPSTSLKIIRSCACTRLATSDDSTSLSPSRISSTATVSFSLTIGITPAPSNSVIV